MPSSRLILGIVPWYSVLIVCGICVALFLCTREEKRLGLKEDTTVDLALYVIPSGIVGARLYYVAFSWPMFRDDPLSILKIWNGGLAIYGAILGGLIGVCLFSWRRRISLPALCDMVVPGLALAQAIGRWGNFFNMEAYGLPVTEPSLQFFPFAVRIVDSGAEVWHMATFFYESCWDLGVFAVLWLMRRRIQRSGDLTLLYMLFYGAGRAMIEGLRMDSLMTSGGGARVSQLLSVALCLAAVLVFVLRSASRSRAARWLLCASALPGAALGYWMSTLAAQQPFPGYGAVWAASFAMLACFAVLVCLGDTRRLLAVPPLMLSALAVLIHARLAQAYSGPETSLALCASLSSLLMGLGACAYAAASAMQTRSLPPSENQP